MNNFNKFKTFLLEKKTETQKEFNELLSLIINNK